MEDSLNSGLESLKRTVDETKATLAVHYAVLENTLLRIKEIGRIAHETRDRASAALYKLRESPDDNDARQLLEGCQALTELLKESLSQYIAKRDCQLLDIYAATNAIKVSERMIIEFSTEPDSTRL